MSDDDADKLHEISQQLPALDVDSTSAEHIARRARENVGRGPSRKRLVESIVVAIFVASILVWIAIKIVAAYS